MWPTEWRSCCVDRTAENGRGLCDAEAAGVPDTGDASVSAASEEEGGWGNAAGPTEEWLLPAPWSRCSVCSASSNSSLCLKSSKLFFFFYTEILFVGFSLCILLFFLCNFVLIFFHFRILIGWWYRSGCGGRTAGLKWVMMNDEDEAKSSSIWLVWD